MASHFTIYTSPATAAAGPMRLAPKSGMPEPYRLSHVQSTVTASCVSVDFTWNVDLPQERASARGKIEEFAGMPENWDGYGALPVRPETAQNALDALRKLPDEIPMPDITPNPNGTISFEWESPSGVGHLELGRTRFSFYIKARQLGQPVLRDWRIGEPAPNIGQLVKTHLYPTAQRAKIIVGSGSIRSSTGERYFLPDNPDARFSMAS
jgi:hypothetical protein